MLSILLRLFLIGFVLTVVVRATIWMIPYIIVGYIAVYAYNRYYKRETSL
jgi:uncharacterized membrane protein